MRHDFYCFQSLENIEEMRGGSPPFQFSGQMLHTFRMWVVSLHVLSPSPSPSLSPSKFIIVPMATDRLTDRLGSEPILSVGVNLTGTKCVNGPLPFPLHTLAARKTYYRLQTKLQYGIVFTRECLHGGGGIWSHVPWGRELVGMSKGVGMSGGYFRGGDALGVGMCTEDGMPRGGRVCPWWVSWTWTRGDGVGTHPFLLTPSGGHHMYGRQATVRILLECILV